jgi:protein-disulfide isomerase
VAENAAAYLYVLSTLGMGVVIYFAYASVFVLHTLCVFCFITYVGMIGLFVVAGGASEATLPSIPGRLGEDLSRLVRSPLALALAALFLGGSAAAFALFPRDSVVARAASASAGATDPAAAAAVTESQQAAFDDWFDSQPRAELAVLSDGAAVVIVKFNDFQCPACAQAYFQHKDVLARYAESHPGAVKFVAIDFPLNPECNAGVSSMVHPAACAGAVAVRLAARGGDAGVVETMEEWLYSNQQGASPEAVRDAAREIAGVTDFDEQYAAVLSDVKQDADMGGRLAIQGTPTFFINGVRIEGSPRAEYLDAAIAHELRRAGVIAQP